MDERDRLPSGSSPPSSRQITWPVVTASPASHREAGHASRPRRVDLVLHLHRLDDADHLARLDLVALGDVDRKDRALHRADDRIVAGAGWRVPRRALAAPGELARTAAPARSRRTSSAPAVDLDEDAARPAAPAGGAAAAAGVSSAACAASSLRLDEAVAGRRRDEARGEERAMEAEQRRHALDHELVERAQHPAPRVLAVDVRGRSASRSSGRRASRSRCPRSTPESTRTPGPPGSR